MDTRGREIDALRNRCCVRGIIYLLRRTPTPGLLRNLWSGTRPAQQYVAPKALTASDTARSMQLQTSAAELAIEAAEERKNTTSTFTRTPVVAEIADRTGYDARSGYTGKLSNRFRLQVYERLVCMIRFNG